MFMVRAMTFIPFCILSRKNNIFERETKFAMLMSTIQSSVLYTSEEVDKNQFELWEEGKSFIRTEFQVRGGQHTTFHRSQAIIWLMMMMFNFVWAKTLINENKNRQKQKERRISSCEKRKKEKNARTRTASWVKQQASIPALLSIVLYANWRIYGIWGTLRSHVDVINESSR